MTRRALVVVLLTAAAAAPTATAKSTIEATIVPVTGGAFEALDAGAGEPYVVRRAPGARPSASPVRARKRRSLLYFGQLTDPQILDEVSPIRVDFLDQAGGDVKDGWRPNDVMSTQTFDQTVREMNAQRVSR